MENIQNILLIEDDDDIRESLVELLELEGYEVFAASNGKEGVETLEFMPRPSLILLDLMMPVMTGWEFLKATAKKRSQEALPVFLLSAYMDFEHIPETTSFVPKPIDFNDFLKKVHYTCHYSQMQNAIG